MISFLKRADPVTLVRSPTLTKRAPAPACSTFTTSMSGRDHHRFKAGEQGVPASSRDRARRAIARGLGDCGDMLRSRPAAAAHDVDELAVDPFAHLRGRLGGS